MARAADAPEQYSGFRKPVAAMSKDDIIDTGRALVATRGVMLRITKAATTEDEDWNRLMAWFVDPKGAGETTDLAEYLAEASRGFRASPPGLLLIRRPDSEQ